MNDNNQRRKFATAVAPYLTDAFLLARWLTGSATDAEDVVQESSIRALRAVDTLNTTQGKAWLLAIVRNTAFTWLAKNRPKLLIVTDDEKIFEQAEANAFGMRRESSAELELINRADAEMLRREIAALPLAYREVLVLREFEDLNYREISAVLSIPVGTVMSRLARARSKLIERICTENAKGTKAK